MTSNFFLGSKAAWKPPQKKKKNMWSNLPEMVQKYFFFIFCSSEKLLLQSFTWSSSPDFWVTEKNKNRFEILTEISTHVWSQIFDFEFNLQKYWEIVLRIVSAFFFKLRKPMGKAALYVLFYTFEDLKTLIVFILGDIIDNYR